MTEDPSAGTLARAARAMRDAIEGEHLDYEQIEAYVDGTLSAEEAAHLEVCAMCAEEARDLRAYSGAPETRTTPRRYWLAAAAAISAVAVAGAWLMLRPQRNVVVPNVVQTRQQPPVVTPEDPLAGLGPSLQRTLAQLASGHIPSGAIVADLRGGTERIRGTNGEGSTLGLTAPIGVIEEMRPTFRWISRTPGTYVVEVFDESYRPVATSGSLRGNQWQPARALRRGATYSWQVTRKSGDETITAPAPPQPPARFKIIGDSAASELAKAGDSHLAAGLVYAREGVLDRAIEEMTLAQNEHPDSKEIAQSLRTLRNYQPEPTRTKLPQ